MTLPRNRWLPVLFFLTLFAIAPTMASGQTPAEQWPGLSSSGLQTVYLRDQSGTETSGKLLGLDSDSVMLLVDGNERRFDKADVARIQKRDSIKNGTLIGAVVGIAMGLVTAGISDCPGDNPGGSCGGLRTVTFLTSVGIYAGLGAGIDALIRGRTTIYAAPTSSSRVSSAGAPSARAVLQMGFSW
jgi:hypothetical protein